MTDEGLKCLFISPCFVIYFLEANKIESHSLKLVSKYSTNHLCSKSRTKDIREQLLTDGTQVYETGPVRDETTEG